MGSIGLVKHVQAIRENLLPLQRGEVRRHVAELASHGILNRRQIASALEVSPQAVNNHLRGAEEAMTVPGNINWEHSTTLLRYLEGDNRPYMLGLLHEYGTNPTVAKHLLDNV